MDTKYVIRISEELQISTSQVRNTIALLEGGASIPFISRYRKEVTGSLDETFVTSIRDRLEQLRSLDKRRESVLDSIEEQGMLTDDLKKRIMEAETMAVLEDLYLPYKPKRKTRASIARSKGLEPLAKIIMSQPPLVPEEKAREYTSEEHGILTTGEALAGARDIMAEWVNEHSYARSVIRKLSFREGMMSSRVIRGKEAVGQNYRSYFDVQETVMRVPSHRYLAMIRGEHEGFLRIGIEPPEDKALEILERIFVKQDNACGEQVRMAVEDSYKRLLQPSMETEVRAAAKEKADEYAIRVFVENLRQLLLAPPLGQKNVLAIDPGFRSGCKLVCLDRQGRLLHNETIYPHPPESKVKEAAKKMLSLVGAYKIEAIAIGNGTAGRETERFIRSLRFSSGIIAIMVNESGASVYSASKVAREEFPDYDVTVRGAVSIGRRLMDPLAELVKIDPKSIGVGQYQHDLNQTALQESLEDTVISCVNQVGVEVNTASRQLLSYVSGVGPALAKNIRDFIQENGAFRSREEFKKVPRYGDKAFEQSAGFLRIHDAESPLDRSAVHPESYHIVYQMAANTGCDIDSLIKDEKVRKRIRLDEYVTETVGMPTLTDIMKELARPGRDPREKYDFFEFAKGIEKVEDLEIGMTLPGIITNITAFGAFVDIGVHQDGLVHISEMADRFVRDPNEIVKLNQKVDVRVLTVDIPQKRISLSMKAATCEA